MVVKMNTVNLVIETDGKGISSYELTEFLRYFRATYVAGLKLSESAKGSVLSEEQFIRLVNRIKLTQSVDVVDYLFKIDCENDELEFLDIQRKNPVSIKLSGSCVAILLAAAFSGAVITSNSVEVKIDELSFLSVVEMGGLEVKITSFSEGHNRLCNSFGGRLVDRKKIDDL